ncbi:MULTISPECIES: hypothetical protein [unclassified Streptomyces]|uniref:hypothetical protein n=1 Tax=unclassified Streptomyces TaxID=2593676 RepID=UPI003803173C
MDYRAVDPSYSDDADHTEAQEVATDFVNALRRVRDCQHDEHRIALGWITLEQARRITATVNVAMDELDRYRAAGRVPRTH